MLTLFVLILPFLIEKLYNYLIKKYNIKGFFLLNISIKIFLVFLFESKRIWTLFIVYFCILLMAISFLYQNPSSYNVASDVTNMTWSQFEKHCTINKTNSVKQQIMCSQLKGTIF